jgi:chaperonin cofactor prefoldin
MHCIEQVLVHHMEHELYEVHSSLQLTIERLQEQERQAEARIAELEDQLSKQATLTCSTD